MNEGFYQMSLGYFLISTEITEADIEWLRERRALLPQSKVDAGTFVSKMRDEEWER